MKIQGNTYSGILKGAVQVLENQKGLASAIMTATISVHLPKLSNGPVI